MCTTGVFTNDLFLVARRGTSSTRFETVLFFFLLHKNVHVVDFILFLQINFLKIQYVINIFFFVFAFEI